MVNHTTDKYGRDEIIAIPFDRTQKASFGKYYNWVLQNGIKGETRINDIKESEKEEIVSSFDFKPSVVT